MSGWSCRLNVKGQKISQDIGEHLDALATLSHKHILRAKDHGKIYAMLEQVNFHFLISLAKNEDYAEELKIDLP